jgi:quaternary ammonium compound-resistance protein SugE
MAWIYLLLAGLFEMAFTTCLKLRLETVGAVRIWWTVAFLALSVVSFGFLNLAAEKISLGTAYAVWTGIGAVGTAAVGIIWFKDPADFWRIFFLATIIGSLIGLKLVSPGE